MHTQSIVTKNPGRGGGRVASDRYRQSLELCNDFTGLEKNVNRYDLLLLVKRTGKHAGFTPRMIQLLDYYMAFTRDLDWIEGSRPIVYQSVSRTALDLGVSERLIQKLEKQLFELGCIGYNDSGNCKRFGSRDSQSGKIVLAFGVDLTPLAYLQGDLEEILHEKQLYDQAWLETKRQVSWYRRQIRSMLLEWEEGALVDEVPAYSQAYGQIAMQIRTHIRLEQLRGLLAEHEQLHSEMLARFSGKQVATERTADSSANEGKTQEGSCTSEQQFVHYKYTNQLNKSCSQDDEKSFQKSVVDPTEPEDLISSAGIQHITIKQALLCASDRFLGFMPLPSQPATWANAIDAAYQLRAELHISQQSWGEACQLLGRVGASLCVLITDNATQRAENKVANPAAYFYGMVKKARAGELSLHSSIFGLLEPRSFQEIPAPFEQSETG